MYMSFCQYFFPFVWKIIRKKYLTFYYFCNIIERLTLGVGFKHCTYNSEYTFDKVVAVGTEDGIKVGAPYVACATVTANVVKTGKAKKITVMTYKPKKNAKRKLGHRQLYTKVEITAINA